jgi:crotonobetainyl-CoA:carnitine CoA-transferase CaiB-like acyl-CoA transferase
LQDTPARLRNVAPPVGADSRAVLRELGYGIDQIESLLASGVVQEQVT